MDILTVVPIGLLVLIILSVRLHFSAKRAGIDMWPTWHNIFTAFCFTQSVVWMFCGLLIIQLAPHLEVGWVFSIGALVWGGLAIYTAFRDNKDDSEISTKDSQSKTGGSC